MKKTFLLAVSNIRKAKGHTFSFLILIMLAMSMLTAGIATYSDCSDNFERRYSALNAEDGMIVVTNSLYNDDMLNEFTQDSRVKSSEVRDVMIFDGSFEYSGGSQSKRIIITNKSSDANLGKTEITEETDKEYERSCYLPVIMKTGGGYKLGDDFSFTNMSGEYTFKIKGFFENIYLGSTNLPAIGFMLDEDNYKWFEQQTEGKFDGKYMLARLDEKKDATEFIGDFYSSRCNETNGAECASRTYYSGCKNGRTFLSRIIASIIVAFSLIVVIISLVVIRFRIINSIEDDIKNIGALKAMGYTSRNLIFSYITQFGIICAGGIILGIILASVIMPTITDMLAAQSGMVGNSQLNMGLCAILSVVMLVIVCLTVFLTSRRINKLHPIVALRNGFENHNFKKNHFAFDRTKGSKNLIFGLKNSVAHKGQNIMICVIIAVVSFVCMFVYTLYYNISVNDKAFIQTIAGEVPSVDIAQNTQVSEENLIDEITSDSRVRKAFYNSTQSLSFDGTNIYTYIADDFSMRDTDIIYEGRNPNHDNECAMAGLAAGEKGIKVGDEVTLSLGGNKEKFLVVGLTQTGNNMGYDAELTTEGIRRLSPQWKHADMYVYLNDGVDADDYVDDIKAQLGDKTSGVISISAILDAQMGAYVDMTSLVTIIIAIITCLVITMILFLVIKTMILKNKKSLGIQKALGYTTPQLMLQMALTFMPITVIGGIAGFIGSVFLVNPTFGMCLRSIGVMRVSLLIMIPHFLLITLAIIVYSFLIALLISLKIRKVSAYKMLTDE